MKGQLVTFHAIGMIRTPINLNPSEIMGVTHPVRKRFNLLKDKYLLWQTRTRNLAIFYSKYKLTLCSVLGNILPNLYSLFIFFHILSF